MASLNPYLSFHTNAREAMDFYHSVLGGDLQVMDFTAFEDMGVPEEERGLVMHSQLTTPDGFVLMGSDTPSHVPYVPAAGIAVSISGPDEDQLRAFWDGLSAGGNVTMPLGTPPWGGLFGMFTDKFGIDWMISSGE